MDRGKRLRIGAVSYLNTKPLVWNLPALAPQADLVFDYPSRLADGLASDTLDIALIPSIEFARDPRYSIVSNACIACRGPVLSVKLFFRVPPAEVRTLALDAGSRTSVALSQILLREKAGVHPQLSPLPLEASLDDTTADAILLIGDRAMHSPAGRFAAVWDLGDLWQRWSGLPFVFAMWVARPGLAGTQELAVVESALMAAREEGLAHLKEIAEREGPPQGLTTPQCLSYLRDNLYFYLGEQELAGLNLFLDHANQAGLLPAAVAQKSFVDPAHQAILLPQAVQR